tara:strand:- start:105 stop:299 length:195 start_codon:yes stop_codon:yes gene_type:complete
VLNIYDLLKKELHKMGPYKKKRKSGMPKPKKNKYMTAKPAKKNNKRKMVSKPAKKRRKKTYSSY